MVEKFKLGEIDAFRQVTVEFPSPGTYITYSGTVDNFWDWQFPVGFIDGKYESRTSCNMHPGSELIWTNVEASTVYLLCAIWQGSPSVKFYYRGTNEIAGIWHLARDYNLPELIAENPDYAYNTQSVVLPSGSTGYNITSAPIMVTLPFNVYDFKLVVGGGVAPLMFFGMAFRRYFTYDYQIFGDNAFEFEINPTTFKQQINGYGVFAQQTMNGKYQTRGMTESAGQIDLHFDFIRGIEEDEAYTNSLSDDEAAKTINTLSHADRYKLEYFAQKRAKLLLVTDEHIVYGDQDGNNYRDYGRIVHHCMITPGSLKFNRLPVSISATRQIVDSVTGKLRPYVYQESYSADFSLTLLERVN